MVHSWYTLTSDCYETAEGYTAMTRKNKLNKYIASFFLVGFVAPRSRRRSFVAFSRVFHAFLTCFWRLPDPVCQNFRLRRKSILADSGSRSSTDFCRRSRSEI